MHGIRGTQHALRWFRVSRNQLEGENMFLTVEDAFRFAAELECGLRRHLDDETLLQPPRHLESIITYFERKLGAGFKFDIREINFLDVDDLHLEDSFGKSKPAASPLRSFIINLEEEKDGALILLNSQPPNYCWRRLCTVKETSQAIIRQYAHERAASLPTADGEKEIDKEYMCPDESNPDIKLADTPYDDTREVESSAELLLLNGAGEVTLEQFDDPKLPIQRRIEKSGEILATTILFPPNEMVAARNGLLQSLGSIDGSLNYLRFADFLGIAEQWKIPKKIVQSYLNYEGLENCCNAYEKRLRDLGC